MTVITSTIIVIVVGTKGGEGGGGESAAKMECPIQLMHFLNGAVFGFACISESKSGSGVTTQVAHLTTQEE